MLFLIWDSQAIFYRLSEYSTNMQHTRALSSQESYWNSYAGHHTSISKAAGKPFLFPFWSQIKLGIWYCVCLVIYQWVSKERIPHQPASSPHTWKQEGNVCSLLCYDFPSITSHHFLMWNNSASVGGKMEQAY